MAGSLSTILVLLVAVSLGLYQLYISPFLDRLGVWRTVEPVGNTECTTVHELPACEKIVLHDATGVLYLACSTQENRLKWIPATNVLEGTTQEDYIATYDPSTSKVTRLRLENYNNSGLSVHGMDVVPSASNSNELFVYLINHRPPRDNQDPKVSGADSVIEIFKTKVSSDTLVHISTVEHSVISTPNDVTGYPDGSSFYFTNDHGPHKAGNVRLLRALFTSIASVGFCKSGDCSLVVPSIYSANGIVRAPNDTIYVASTSGAAVSVFERQKDNSLVFTDYIPTEVPLDNLAIDTDGVVWAAGFPKAFDMSKHMKDPRHPSPSRGVKISVNKGPGAFYGEKYKVEKAFEDDGLIAPGATSVAHDAQRKRLFISGLVAPALAICKI